MRDETRSALLIALGGFVMLSLGDIIVKSMAGGWAGSAIAALRYTIGAVGLAVLVAVRHGRAGFVCPRPWLQIGRGFGVAVATLGFFMGVMVMPLADASAIVFTSPIWTLIFSMLFLGERPSAKTLAAIVLAFAGVIAILRPNVMELGLGAFWPLVAALGMSMLILLNRKAAGLAPGLVMQFLVAAFGAPFLLLAAIAGHHAGAPGMVAGTPDWTIVARSAIVAVTATIGHWAIYSATTRASAATVAPMTYVQLLVALAAGIALFGDIPDWPMLLGAGLIVGAGLLLWSAQAKPAVIETPD